MTASRHGPLWGNSRSFWRAIAIAATVSMAGPLAGCATPPEPKIETRIVEVPVAVKCAVTIPVEPAYPDTKEALAAAPGIFAKVQLLLAGREVREAYKNEVKAALIGCTG